MLSRPPGEWTPEQVLGVRERNQVQLALNHAILAWTHYARDNNIDPVHLNRVADEVEFGTVAWHLARAIQYLVGLDDLRP